MNQPTPEIDLKQKFEEVMQDGWDCGDYDDMLDAAAKLAEELLIAARNLERRNLLLRLKQFPPVDWIDAQTWIDEHLAKLEALSSTKGETNE